jgi:hypothetical protein
VLAYIYIFSLACVYASRCIDARRLSFYRAGSRGVTGGPRRAAMVGSDGEKSRDRWR